MKQRSIKTGIVIVEKGKTMSECMMFPNEWAKFLEDYSFWDDEEIYTNGSRLIPTFRVEQMMEHYLRKAVNDNNVGSKWIPVTERLPESNKAVLISARCETFGFRHTLKAAHIGHHEATTEDNGWQEYEGDTEYDEEKDCFWIPECWWEDNFVDGNSNWIIDSDYEVTHWMPLPEPPKKEGGAE